MNTIATIAGTVLTIGSAAVLSGLARIKPSPHRPIRTERDREVILAGLIIGAGGTVTLGAGLGLIAWGAVR